MQQTYLEVRLVLDAGLAEAAELALIELGAAGTSRPLSSDDLREEGAEGSGPSRQERTPLSSTDASRVGPTPPAPASPACLVSGYFPGSEAPGRQALQAALRRYLPAEADPAALARMRLTIERKPWENWAAASRRSFRAMQATQRLWIAPPWDRTGVPADATEILIIEPGAAFGIGTHATTRGCLEALETWAASWRNATRGIPMAPLSDPNKRTLTATPIAQAAILDIGTGTGILALRAAQLGATGIVALDSDPAAVAAARRNAQHNGLTERVTIFAGTLAALREGTRFELVLANLLLDPLVALASRIAAHLEPRGSLIASGIRREDQAELEGAFAVHGCRPIDTYGTAEWLTLALSRD